jgi:hypothetical protein
MSIVGRSFAGFLIVLLVACGGSVEGSLPGGAVSGTLGPAGGVIIGPDGMAFGVPVGNLDRDVVVTLARAPMPAVEVPDGVAAEGRAYQITSSFDVHAESTDRGFVIGLPVPEGVDGGRVALAWLVRGEDAFDGSEDVWYVARGFHDAEQGWFVTYLPAVLVEGDVVVLVSGPDLVAQVATPPPPRDGAATSADSFCPGWHGEFEVVAGTGISFAEKASFKRHLDDALATYRNLGYEPFLLRETGWAQFLTPMAAAIFADCSKVKYEASLEVGNRSNVYGMYSSVTQTITMYRLAISDGRLRAMTFHELFHSLQARHLGPAEMLPDRDYFLEATATLSEALAVGDLDVTRQTRFSLRTVDVNLAAPSAATHVLPYRAQDFWSYVARRFGRPFHTFTLDFLRGGGVAPADVDAVFKRAPYGYPFAELYRDWVLDQIFDVDACTFEPAAVHTLWNLGRVDVKDDGPSGLPAAGDEKMGPLTARVFKLVAEDNTVDEPFQLAVRVEGSWADLGVHTAAVIQRRSSGGCALHREDAFESFASPVYAAHRLTVEPFTNDEFFVVLVNGSYDDWGSGRMLLDPAPKLSEVTVTPTTLLAEMGSTVNFRLPYRDIGENLERINVIVKLGGKVEFAIGVDTAPSDITSGFDAASGTGLYNPSVIVYCSEKGRNPLTFTLQLVDELQFVSQEKSVDITVDYGDCP